MAKSTPMARKSKASKPDRPYPGFPLFPHATKRWAKKIRGKTVYFGPWDDPQAALEKFNREWPFLSEGRTPPPADTGNGCTIQVLANTFLTSKQNKLDAGELAQRSFQDYYNTCEQLVKNFSKDRRVDDLRPDDFEGFRSSMAKRFGTTTLRNEINRCRVVFKFAHDQRLIEHPVVYGQSFNRPSAKSLRRSRREAGPRMFEADELRRILDACDVQLKAMVLLGINTGFGNSDCATLPLDVVDLKNGWINFPRPKTEIERRVPLWPETVEAVREAIGKRPKPKDADAENCAFLTSTGRRWVRVQPHKTNVKKSTPLDALSQKFAKLLKSLDINGRRNFYALRHGFETIGGESRDQVAVNAIMGHADNSMAAVYGERISDERLQAVVEVVRKWLFES